MLTFTLTRDNTLRCTGAGKPFSVFPAKAVSGDINLMAKPEETFNAEIVTWPGEYDIAGVTIRGIGQMEGQQVSYVVEADGYRFAFPSLPLQEWTDSDLEKAGDVQVLCLNAEDAKKALKIIEELDPRILFILPGSDGKMDPDMLKQCGAMGKEHVSEHKLKGGLPAEGREVVVFSA
jgi:hypothetical protein